MRGARRRQGRVWWPSLTSGSVEEAGWHYIGAQTTRWRYGKVVLAWRPQSQCGHPSAVMCLAGIPLRECLQLVPSLSAKLLSGVRQVVPLCQPELCKSRPHSLQQSGAMHCMFATFCLLPSTGHS